MDIRKKGELQRIRPSCYAKAMLWQERKLRPGMADDVVRFASFSDVVESALDEALKTNQ